MKTITLTSTLAFAMALNAGAQGVHLLPGQSLSIEFNGVGDCRSSEPTFAGGTAGVSFGNDILAPGEQLFLEMFEDNLNGPVVASRIYSPAAPIDKVSLASPGSWLDYQGVIRLSMVSGSLDVSYAHFWVRPDPSTYCDTVVLVPEPRAGILLALGGILPATVFGFRHARRRDRPCMNEARSRYCIGSKNTALTIALVPVCTSGLLIRMILRRLGSPTDSPPELSRQIKTPGVRVAFRIRRGR